MEKRLLRCKKSKSLLKGAESIASCCSFFPKTTISTFQNWETGIKREEKIGFYKE